MRIKMLVTSASALGSYLKDKIHEVPEVEAQRFLDCGAAMLCDEPEAIQPIEAEPVPAPVDAPVDAPVIQPIIAEPVAAPDAKASK
jgi:hypothetical protein